MIPSIRLSSAQYVVPGTSSSEAALIKTSEKRRWRLSIFSKLLAIMLGTLVILLVIVTVIFALVIFPTSVSTTEYAARRYSQLLAATQPDLEVANKIHKDLGIDIRYEGATASWTTSETLPTVEQVRNRHAHLSFGHQYHLVSAANGGTYLFAWDVRDKMHRAHQKFLGMLLLMIA